MMKQKLLELKKVEGLGDYVKYKITECPKYQCDLGKTGCESMKEFLRDFEPREISL